MPAGEGPCGSCNFPGSEKARAHALASGTRGARAMAGHARLCRVRALAVRRAALAIRISEVAQSMTLFALAIYCLYSIQTELYEFKWKDECGECGDLCISPGGRMDDFRNWHFCDLRAPTRKVGSCR